MKRLFWAAAVYTFLGLAGGLYYRELTKAHDFTDDTQLAVVHTHLLTLGALAMLLFLVLERVLNLSRHRRLFGSFFWIYNLGLLLTAAMMTVIGTRTVLGLSSGPALAGPSGLGHILLTVAFVLLFITIGRRVYASAETISDRPAAGSAFGRPGHGPS